MQEPDRAKQASPWHDGERAAQRIVGVAERMEEVGKRVIRPFMPGQHRLDGRLLPQQSYTTSAGTTVSPLAVLQ